MFNFKLFFDPIIKEDFAESMRPNTLADSLVLPLDSPIQWSRIDMAMVGINADGGADQIRRQLYALKKGNTEPVRIADLGNLRLKMPLEQHQEENYLMVSEVCRALLTENVLPILIGGANDWAWGQYLGYQELEKMIYMLHIDSVLDIEETAQTPESKYLTKILLHYPNYLFGMGWLGYQSYLNEVETLQMCERLGFDLMSVGKIRTHIAQAEPLIRMADMLSIDVRALRRSDAPAQPHTFHFGLTADELAQLAWYAGTNEKLSSVGFYGYYADLEGDSPATAEVIAVAIWYFIEGFYHRHCELPLRGNFYTKYIVPLESQNQSLVFYKSTLSERWWLEIDSQAAQDDFRKSKLVPCNYADYLSATEGILPDRWLKSMG